jgi:hypothetical protein
MSNRNRLLSRAATRAPLAVCLTAALGLSLSAAQAGDVWSSIKSAHAPAKPAVPPHIVTSCDDDATIGTLRYEVLQSVSGDTVDMSSLACSTITLSGWPIRVTQGDLHLVGPAAPAHLTIDGAASSIVLAHYGTGTLDISNLTIANGDFVSDTFPTGGCIYSNGNVSLTHSVVTNCNLESTSVITPALGAGVYTRGNLTLAYSTINDSHVYCKNGAFARGGGAAVMGDFSASHSTISNNTAINTSDQGFGGGVYAKGNIVMDGSTISGNYGQISGALDIVNSGFTASIINSTISSNSARYYAGIFTKSPLTLDNSTIAFNHSSRGSAAESDGLYSWAPLVLRSSIIAGNAGQGGPSDLGGSQGTMITGSDNLITYSTLMTPGGTLTVCPKLEPLADNGGPTLTHALKPTSPAIDHGFAGGLPIDQRLAPRPADPAADIGSVERQPGEPDERIFVSGFDGLCDQ